MEVPSNFRNNSTLPKEGSQTCLPKICSLAEREEGAGFLIASDLSLQRSPRYKGRFNFTKLEAGGDTIDTVADGVGANWRVSKTEAGGTAPWIGGIQMEKSRFASEDVKERKFISLMLTPGHHWNVSHSWNKARGRETHLSQWKPSTLSLHAHRPVSTLHSPVLPARLQEQGLKESGERITHQEPTQKNFQREPSFSFREQQSPLPAPGFREGVETWLAPVALITHHARFTAALAIAVALRAEGACRESSDRHLSRPTQLY